MSSISLQCPSCGRQDIGFNKQCECGYMDNKTVIAELEKKSKGLARGKPQKNINYTKKPVIKEIDSWVFAFSQEENCINLSTPALKAFELKLTLEDLEELIEFVYRITDSNKTLRKRQLSVETISDLVEAVNSLIEEKRSKISIKFNEEEIKGIETLINNKLKE